MENRFKSAIWREFWDNHNLLSEDAEIITKAKEIQFELINMVVKEAVGKLPQNKIAPSDRMKIKSIEIDFRLGTLIKMNGMQFERPIVFINNLNLFSAFINVEVFSITYSNPDRSFKSNDDLELEGDLHNTKLFKHFARLKKIILIESCPDGIREVEFNR